MLACKYTCSYKYIALEHQQLSHMPLNKKFEDEVQFQVHMTDMLIYMYKHMNTTARLQ